MKSAAIPPRFLTWLLLPILASCVALICAGCTTATPQEVAAARFDPLPKNYQEQIKAEVAPTLKDPYSAVYRFGLPRKGFGQDGVIHGGKKHFGYIVPTYINAKNSFGAYVGEELRLYMYANGAFYNVSESFNLHMGGYVQ